ncbi:hypothetical protein WJX84_005619 [Apatococcus fuscideae]|uniref:Uncharacterized protein n=1 Tax=Apatococcus fuscideae TaxID=2026836 RepID=A0AAW1TJ18_9CHLO
MADHFKLKLVKPGFASLECMVQVLQGCLIIQRARGEVLYKFPFNSITGIHHSPPETCAVKVLLPGNHAATAILVGSGNGTDAEQLSVQLGKILREVWTRQQAASTDGVFAAEALRMQSVLLRGPADAFAFLASADASSETEAVKALLPRRSSLMSKRKISQALDADETAVISVPAIRVAFRPSSSSDGRSCVSFTSNHKKSIGGRPPRLARM